MSHCRREARTIQVPCRRLCQDDAKRPQRSFGLSGKIRFRPNEHGKAHLAVVQMEMSGIFVRLQRGGHSLSR